MRRRNFIGKINRHNRMNQAYEPGDTTVKEEILTQDFTTSPINIGDEPIPPRTETAAGKEILGLPRNAVYIGGGLLLAVGIGFAIKKIRQ